MDHFFYPLKIPTMLSQLSDRQIAEVCSVMNISNLDLIPVGSNFFDNLVDKLKW